jgi:glucose/arabinose dehydrogenase
MRGCVWAVLLGTALGTGGCNCPAPAPTKKEEPADLLAKLSLPPGFSIAYYAEGVDGARSLTRGAQGTIFVGSRKAGKVHALVDADGDHKAERVVLLADGLRQPNGVAFRDGSLYVAEINRVIRFDDIEARLDDPPDPVVVNDTFPTDGHHGWKFIRFGPDGKLYVPVGAPCNVCEEEDSIYASITRMNADGSGREVFASGVRNSVGFDWHPQTDELWFTDNGRDMLGDDRPPDELNHAPKLGMHFGFPYCHGGDIEDPEHGQGHPCSEFEPPAQRLGPHVASLGMRFYDGDAFPAEYRHQIFIAEHGSWNRSTPIGYRVMLVRLQDNKAIRYEPFATGWLSEDGTAWGRPVDLMVMPDGALLLSDDRAGAIYRITYSG